MCTRWRVAFLLSCLPMLFGPATTADDLCGATILASLKLDHDLTCAGNGIAIGADGIKLNLNGHTIAGSGSGNGVNVVSRTNVWIVGGTVRNFEAGVRIMNSTAVVVKGNELRENTEGVDCAAGCVGNTIKENEFWDNRARGIMVRGGTFDNVIKENTFSGNRVGVLLFASVDGIVKENTISASGLAGIRVNVFATGNLVVENTLTSNPVGIEILVTPTGSATGNTFVENTLETNTCGLKGPLGGNTVRENQFERNGADICP